jgi:menaquinone-9 beta-reductase
MNDRYDIVVAGGRCAGSAAAITLGRAGYRVLLVERSRMPSDTLSTHVLWPDGIAALRRLGVLEQVLETGAPPVYHFRLAHGDDEILTELIPFEGIGYFLCLRRHLLDGILFEAAAATNGVEARDRARLDDLIWTGDRVTGATIVSGGVTHEVQADLVIGADGRDSSVASLVAASEDDIVEPGRFWYYGYFSGARNQEPLAVIESDSETDTVLSAPGESGLQMVAYGAFNEGFQEFRSNYRDAFVERVNAHPCFNRLLRDAELASPIYGIAGVRGYYRNMSGPGWALAGDAAHQKDPIVGRGINDALLGGEDLARELGSGISATALERYEQRLRERTRGSSFMARIFARPDRHMSASWAEVLGTETATPDGLARVLGLEYGGITDFDDLFMTGRDRVVELPAVR